MKQDEQSTEIPKSVVAWGIEKYGSNDLLKKITVSLPAMGDEELTIQVKAVGINPVDYKIRKGEFKLIMHFKFPIILGHDFAGTVVKVGSKVTRFKSGDSVFGLLPHGAGCLSKFMVTQEQYMSHMPTNLTFDEAAGIPVAGLTAWQALFTVGQLKKGQRVFISGGSGGVGSLAVQLAKNIGAYVIASTSTGNVDLVKSLGADEVIDYKTQDISKITPKVDVVLDAVGGQSLAQVFPIVKEGGIIISIVGPPTPASTTGLNVGLHFKPVFFILSLTTRLRAKFHRVRYEFLPMAPHFTILEKLAELLSHKSLRPVLDKVYKFDDTNEALAYVETERARGKVIVQIV